METGIPSPFTPPIGSTTMPSNEVPNPVESPLPAPMASTPIPDNGTGGQFFSSSTLPPLTKLLGVFFRAMPIILTFIAATVMGTASQKLDVLSYYGIPDDHFPSSFERPTIAVKTGNFSALVYFVVVNVLAIAYSIISLATSVFNKVGSSKLEMLLVVGDMVFVFLLFTSNGAASAISVALDQGIDKYNWDGGCKFIGSFCSHLKAAIAFSMLASFAYFLLVIMTIFGFSKRSSC